MTPRKPHPATRLVALALAAQFLMLPSTPARSDPTPGFLETWSGTSLGNWGGGGSPLSNPGAGGVGGVSDGFLMVSQLSLGNLATRTEDAAYSGNWRGAGIIGVKVWLKDVGNNDALEIHFGIGTSARDAPPGNVWVYNEGFAPPENSWAEFVVDVRSETNFTQIHGTGTFDDALQNVDRVLFRHDVAPYTQFPDATTGDFGIDSLLLTNESVPTLPTSWGRIKALYR